MKQATSSLHRNMRRSELISWFTCYNFSFATVPNSSESDMIIVGDSGAMVALGYSDTFPVRMNELILFTDAVRPDVPERFIVGDIPKRFHEASDFKD